MMVRFFAFLIFLLAAGPAAAQSAAAPEPGELFRDCPDCPEMVVVPPGDFEMGGKDTPYEGPPHLVTIAKPSRSGGAKPVSPSGTPASPTASATTGRTIMAGAAAIGRSST